MMFQQYITGEDNPNDIVFYIPIGSAKINDYINFHPYALGMKYV